MGHNMTEAIPGLYTLAPLAEVAITIIIESITYNKNGEKCLSLFLKATKVSFFSLKCHFLAYHNGPK